MTREEIINTPKLVDCMLDESVIADSREKLRKRLDEVCNLAIRALEQEPSGDAISRQAVYDAITEIDCGINMDIYTDEVRKIIDDIPTVGMVKVHSKVRVKE